MEYMAFIQVKMFIQVSLCTADNLQAPYIKYLDYSYVGKDKPDLPYKYRYNFSKVVLSLFQDRSNVIDI